MVLETSEFSGGYILGFRVEKLDDAFEEINNLFRTYSQNPIFGVEVTFEDVETNPEAAVVKRIEDKLEIIDTGYSPSFALPTNKSNYALAGGA